jgi:hypothetical protein
LATRMIQESMASRSSLANIPSRWRRLQFSQSVPEQSSPQFHFTQTLTECVTRGFHSYVPYLIFHTWSGPKLNRRDASFVVTSIPHVDESQNPIIGSSQGVNSTFYRWKAFGAQSRHSGRIDHWDEVGSSERDGSCLTPSRSHFCFKFCIARRCCVALDNDIRMGLKTDRENALGPTSIPTNAPALGALVLCDLSFLSKMI